MKMNKVKIKNFKGIKIIDISTEKNMIFISGPNGAGKSSFCDAIMTTLSGNDKAIKRPIREGESMASVVIELDGYKVTQVIRQGKPRTVTVQPLDSATPMKGPQAWLNEHIGNLRFDPSEFARLSEKEQRETLMQLAGLDLFTEEEKIKEIEDERLLIGRDVTQMSKPTEEEVDEAKKADVGGEVSVSELSNRYNKETLIRQEFNQAQQEIINYSGELGTLEARIEKVKANLATLRLVKDTEEDADALKAKIDNAEELNTKIRASKAILESNDKHLAKQKEYEEKTSELEQARDMKKQLIEAAEYPIEGLSVDDDGVTYNGIPFSQINDSQKIVIGTLIALALIPEGGIKMIFIKLGSLLDDKALAYLEKVSLEQDAKFVIEFVGDSKGGIMIEDGEVVE